MMILLLHLSACLFMTGVIWLVQLLVYPNFKILGATEFKKHHGFHMDRITWLVAPLMLIELVTAIYLAYHGPTFFLYNLMLVAFLWFWTGLVNVPSHKALAHDIELSKDYLVLKNWPRTIIWTLRAVLLVWYLSQQIPG